MCDVNERLTFNRQKKDVKTKETSEITYKQTKERWRNKRKMYELTCLPLQACEFKTFPMVFGKSPNPPLVSTMTVEISSNKFVTKFRRDEGRRYFSSDWFRWTKHSGTRVTVILFDLVEISRPNFLTFSEYSMRMRTTSGGNSRTISSSKSLEFTVFWPGKFSEMIRNVM